MPLNGPWQDTRSALDAAPALTVAVETIAAEARAQVVACVYHSRVDCWSGNRPRPELAWRENRVVCCLQPLRIGPSPNPDDSIATYDSTLAAGQGGGGRRKVSNPVECLQDDTGVRAISLEMFSCRHWSRFLNSCECVSSRSGRSP